MKKSITTPSSPERSSTDIAAEIAQHAAVLAAAESDKSAAAAAGDRDAFDKADARCSDAKREIEFLRPQQERAEAREREAAREVARQQERAAARRRNELRARIRENARVVDEAFAAAGAGIAALRREALELGSMGTFDAVQKFTRGGTANVFARAAWAASGDLTEALGLQRWSAAQWSTLLESSNGILHDEGED